jgi:predicted nucleotidyltransferase
MKSLCLEAHSLKIVQDILKKNLPSCRVVAFGSRVTGHAKPHSDLDLCIMSKEALTFSQISQLREDFSESSLPIRVDIVDWQTITPEFKKIIRENCLKIR